MVIQRLIKDKILVNTSEPVAVPSNLEECKDDLSGLKVLDIDLETC